MAMNSNTNFITSRRHPDTRTGRIQLVKESMSAVCQCSKTTRGVTSLGGLRTRVQTNVRTHERGLMRRTPGANPMRLRPRKDPNRNLPLLQSIDKADLWPGFIERGLSGRGPICEISGREPIPQLRAERQKRATSGQCTWDKT